MTDKKEKSVKASSSVKKGSDREKASAFPSSPRGDFLARLKKEKISAKVIEAFSNVDQEHFFDPIFKDKLWGEGNIPLGHSSRSDSFLSLARMIQYLDPDENDRILEVGTGSGYSTAVLSLLCREVVTVETDEYLAKRAKKSLYDNDFGNVRFFVGDGTAPDEGYGAIDGVIIHAACRKRPLSVLANLKARGRVVYAMGPAHGQQIAVMENRESMDTEYNFPVKLYEQGIFMLVDGAYGYNVDLLPLEELLAENAIEPPKSSEAKDFLFVPKTED